eukprot:1625319-Amphidinium_carterae.1
MLSGVDFGTLTLSHEATVFDLKQGISKSQGTGDSGAAIFGLPRGVVPLAHEAGAIQGFIRMLNSEAKEVAAQGSRVSEMLLGIAQSSEIWPWKQKTQKGRNPGHVMWTLSPMCRHRPPLDMVYMPRLLRLDDTGVLAHACWIGALLTEGPNEPAHVSKLLPHGQPKSHSE